MKKRSPKGGKDKNKQATPPAPNPQPAPPLDPNQQQPATPADPNQVPTVDPNQVPAVDPNAVPQDPTAQPDTTVQGTAATEDGGFINGQVSNMTKFFGNYGMTLPVGLAVVGVVLVVAAVAVVTFIRKRRMQPMNNARPTLSEAHNLSMSSAPSSEPRQTGSTSFFSRFTSGFGGAGPRKSGITESNNRQSELPSESNYESQGPYSEKFESQYFSEGLTENYPASSAQTDSVFIRAP